MMLKQLSHKRHGLEIQMAEPKVSFYLIPLNDTFHGILCFGSLFMKRNNQLSLKNNN